MSNVVILLLLCGDNVDLHQSLTLTLTLVLTMHKPAVTISLLHLNLLTLLSS